jgi:hypothetical protein
MVLINSYCWKVYSSVERAIDYCINGFGPSEGATLYNVLINGFSNIVLRIKNGKL